jgi:hypothetical protein
MKKKIKTKNHLLIIGLCVMTIAGSCSKDDDVRLPKVTTSNVSRITSASAICGGIVESDGGSKIISSGVVWNQEDYPVDWRLSTKDTILLGTFISKITKLKPNTKYYVKAYATNGSGTAFGNKISFITLKGCLFTFRGKSYEGAVARCYSPEGWDNFLFSNPDSETFQWSFSVSDGKETGSASVWLDDPTIDYPLFSDVAEVTISGDTYYFNASGLHTLFGMYYPGNLTGTCSCTEQR